MVIETLTVPKAENGCLWNIGLCVWSGFVSVPETVSFSRRPIHKHIIGCN